VMERDTLKMREDKPFYFTNLKSGEGLKQIIEWLAVQMQDGTGRRAMGWDGRLAFEGPASLTTHSHGHHHHH